jgi:hypothetical protein
MPEPILRYFQFAHLPPALQSVSRPYRLLAHGLVGELPRCPERTVALRKLLESKDAAVRAALPPEAATGPGGDMDGFEVQL